VSTAFVLVNYQEMAFSRKNMSIFKFSVLNFFCLPVHLLKWKACKFSYERDVCGCKIPSVRTAGVTVFVVAAVLRHSGGAGSRLPKQGTRTWVVRFTPRPFCRGEGALNSVL